MVGIAYLPCCSYRQRDLRLLQSKDAYLRRMGRHSNMHWRCFGCFVCITGSIMSREKLISNLSKALWDSDLIASRLSLSLAEFFWSIMLLLWGSSHDLFARPTYKQMAVIMPAEAWGALLLMSACMQMTIILNGDMHSKFAKYFAAFNGVLWVYIGIVSPLLSVYPPPAAMGGEFALALAAVWIWVRPYILARGPVNE